MGIHKARRCHSDYNEFSNKLKHTEIQIQRKGKVKHMINTNSGFYMFCMATNILHTCKYQFWKDSKIHKKLKGIFAHII